MEGEAGEQVGVSNGSSKQRMAPHKADDIGAGGARHKVSTIGGQERGKSTTAAANRGRSSTAATDAENKQNWMDYQMQLQARVGLLQESQAVESEAVQQCTVADSAVVDPTRRAAGDGSSRGSSSSGSSSSSKTTSETHTAGGEVETFQQPEAVVSTKEMASYGRRQGVPAEKIESGSPARTNGHDNASSSTSNSVERAVAEIAGARHTLAVAPNAAATASVKGYAYSRMGVFGEATVGEYASAAADQIEGFAGQGSMTAAAIETPRRDPQGIYSVGNNGVERTSSASVSLSGTHGSSTISTATSQFERNLSSGADAGVLEGRVTGTAERRAWCNEQEHDAIDGKSVASSSYTGDGGTEMSATIAVESDESGHEPADEDLTIAATTLEARETTIGDGSGFAHNPARGALLQRQQTRAQVGNPADIYGKGVAAAAAAVADGATDDDYNDVLNFLTDSKSSSSLSSASPRKEKDKTGSTPPASSSDTRERAAQGSHQASGGGMQTPGNPLPASTAGAGGDTGRATAWSNVHARRNLQILLEGLDSDYGVTAGAKENCVPKVCDALGCSRSHFGFLLCFSTIVPTHLVPHLEGRYLDVYKRSTGPFFFVDEGVGLCTHGPVRFGFHARYEAY